MGTEEKRKYFMTDEDYEQITRGMNDDQKRKFDQNFDDPNGLMSLGAMGLIKTWNDAHSPKEVATRRKDIEKNIEKIRSRIMQQ